MRKARGSILIVEDNPTEQLLLRTALADIHVHDIINTVSDGDEAIDFLEGRPPYNDRSKFPFPTFLLTDLKMPRVNGLELLLYIKHSHWVIVPTIVLTMSSDPDDVKHAYLAGANSYHVKPSNLNDLREGLRTICAYWMNAEIPPIDISGNLMPTRNDGKLSSQLRHPVHLPKPSASP